MDGALGTFSGSPPPCGVYGSTWGSLETRMFFPRSSHDAASVSRHASLREGLRQPTRIDRGVVSEDDILGRLLALGANDFLMAESLGGRGGYAPVDLRAIKKRETSAHDLLGELRRR
jgi:hypothetical protein